MSVLIKSFQKDGIHFSVIRVTPLDAFIKDKDGNYVCGYVVSGADEKNNTLRLLSAERFTRRPTRHELDGCVERAKQSRTKMDSSGGVEETLNLLEEMGFKPEGKSSVL